MRPAAASPSSPPRAGAPRAAWIWPALLAAWLLFLCLGPDPRPLGAPEWAVGAVQALTGMHDAGARAVATLALRIAGATLLGALLMLACGGSRWSWRSGAAIAAAPAIAVAASWIQLGYFPIRPQIQIVAIGAALGALGGLALRRNRAAAIAVVAIACALGAWGLSTGISDELDAAARAVGQHVLARADEVPDGDPGFVRLLEIALAFAEDNAHGRDPVPPNRAAVLALGVILGDETLAGVARRHIDEQRVPDAEALRDRITLFGRQDWSRHFWVSAALTILSDAERSIAVGMTKELMDAQPGGSGFSFADLAADAAGNCFALAATRDAASARAMQALALRGIRLADVVPELRDLPEGLSRDAIHREYGGLGGDGTDRVVAEIRRRLAGCNGLQ